MRILPGLLAALLFASEAGAQLRIVDYNTGEGVRDGMSTLLAAMAAESLNGVSKAPDLFTLQEQTSGTTTTQGILNLLNGIYGAGTYARSTLEGQTNGAGRQEIIYRTTTLQLIAQTTANSIGTAGAVSQTMRYELRPVGYDAGADFYVYVSHYKASSGSSNEVRRNVEALQVRANADALGEGAHILYTGDFNIYRSAEAMWGTLTGSGAGQAFDPANRVGAWSNNAAFKDIHTQSPVTTARYGGQVTGGMDDRFDFQLASGEFLDAEGLSYLAGSYHAFGNTGTHAFNGEITSGSAAALQARLPGYSLDQAAAVLTALTTVSDHLPVVAQYQLPAKMAVQVGYVPGRIIVGAEANVAVVVTNVAPVLAALGADELDYAVVGTNAVQGEGSGSVLALSAGNAVSLVLKSDVAGAQAGGIAVDSDSQAAANAHFATTISYEVLDHARAQFAGEAAALSLALDFGEVAQFSDAGTRTFSLANWISPLGSTAGLDLDEIVASGAAAAFFTDLALFSDLGGGDAFEFHLSLETGTVGDFHASYALHFSDEDLLGAQRANSLTLDVTGRVTAVPEPGTLALVVMAGLGFGVIGFQRRRRLGLSFATVAGQTR